MLKLGNHEILEIHEKCRSWGTVGMARQEDGGKKMNAPCLVGGHEPSRHAVEGGVAADQAHTPGAGGAGDPGIVLAQALGEFPLNAAGFPGDLLGHEEND
jgi:hypothetical protein